MLKIEPGKPIKLIWADPEYMDSPEDMYLSRNLDIFVRELQGLTGQNEDEGNKQ